MFQVRDFGYVDSGYFNTMIFMKMRDSVFNMIAYFADYATWDGQASINHR